ncbi:ADL351Wp [Eremothecium gossypii ATCC 10895]|uniref:ADL351Wp n=1 Tax=Eremothecium gossypii (strain ATCC 10895 / CBS 109.51 / FGSC 9923 / NRRL Y-1056) TaxID=284811 RepID=Q75BB8_EREGS|nr:ADL351Wp [Eremothecium gossypii ATCC 10895]AAS51568.1 ADL351Wp [Eremothecium gossypii ATCC 10895]AEY95865.1 FADL351Wp [Eremothecium gossypii FDAG1]
MGADDATSFEKILANVQRRRQEYNGATSASRPEPRAAPAVALDTGPTGSSRVTNAFNQERPTPAAAETDLPKRPRSGQGRTILVSTSQKGNPLLKGLASTNWTYVKSSGTEKVYYDYQVQGRKVVFLSLKYHKLRPEYIDQKLRPFGKTQGNILLCVVDIEDSEDILKELNKTTMFNGFTMLLAFNFEQAAKYLVFLNK